MMDKFKQLNALILNAQNILLVTHPKPDGDALGSICAMIGYLKSLSKNYRAWCADPVPKNFSYLPWSEEILNDFAKLADWRPDLALILDRSDWPHWGIKTFLDRLSCNYQLIILDHHQVNRVKADLSIIDTQYSSTAEIIFHFFQTINFQPSQQMANCLLTGLLTDTENFTNQAAGSETLQAASQLIKLGANFAKLTQKTWQSREFNDLKIMGLALERLQHYQPGLIVSLVKEEEFSRFNQVSDPLAGFTNLLKSLNQGKAALLLTEQARKIKGSLRSIQPNVNVERLAKVLGGGGHKLAAGFTIPGRLEKVNGYWQVI